MKTISKGKLKARMLEVFREIEKSGEELIVTDNNQPVLKVQPLKKKFSLRELFEPFQGKVIYRDHLDSTTEDEWPET